MDIQLRDYQLQAIEGLREGARLGHRAQILYAPTGAGKTILAAYLMRQADEKGKRAAFLVDRTNLVDQTSAVLDRYGISHGCMQAKHWRRRDSERIQICSAQTLEKRCFLPDMDLLIVDEAHCVRKQAAEFIRNSKVRVLGLTASPFTKGLSQLYSNLVSVCPTNQLIGEGHLVPLRVYVATEIDMAGAKVVAGEWSKDEIAERGTKIVGDVVAEWREKTFRYFGGPTKTLVFAATVAHGEELCRQFNEVGFNFRQISYDDGNDETRRDTIEEFRKLDSEIHGLISCEVFTKGFDIPDVRIGVIARPYRKSFSSHIQMIGRIMRAAPGKDFGLLLDHAGNWLRFREDTEELFEHGVSALDASELDRKTRKEPTREEKEAAKCGACGYVLPARTTVCPACGHEKRRVSTVETVPGALVGVEVRGHKAQVPTDPRQHPQLADRESVWRQVCHDALERKKGDVDAAERFAKAQYMNIYGAWPPRALRNTEPEPCSDFVRRRIRMNLIRYFNGKGKK